MKLKVLLSVLLLLLLMVVLVQSAAAMVSTNYRVEWFVPLSGGGGAASSTNYMVNITVGQTAIGSSTSTNYTTGMGFWSAVWNWLVHLPLIVR
jgi:hypothetical protein